MKNALVTGGSRGIGAATAVRLAKDGWNVAVNYVSDSDAAATVVKLCEAEGVQAIAVQADVSDEEQVASMFSEVRNALGNVSALVNNAGITLPISATPDMSVENVRRAFDINVIGSFLCIRELVNQIPSTGGSIVNVSSIASRLGAPGEYVMYAASKGAVDSMTLGLSKEFAPAGIRVNAVRPGVVHTEIHASSGDPSRADRMGSLIPLGRAGQPSEIANSIAWLCSDEASYVTGAILDVAGGR